MVRVVRYVFNKVRCVFMCNKLSSEQENRFESHSLSPLPSSSPPTPRHIRHHHHHRYRGRRRHFKNKY